MQCHITIPNNTLKYNLKKQNSAIYHTTMKYNTMPYNTIHNNGTQKNRILRQAIHDGSRVHVYFLYNQYKSINKGLVATTKITSFPSLDLDQGHGWPKPGRHKKIRLHEMTRFGLGKVHGGRGAPGKLGRSCRARCGSWSRC